ncbi:MAG: ubiquinone/menaquinone biosynthesis methyltransferase [bacterium]|nr:ubiquinone/menaquinone biosynthesis methyltransferase [bacterium]
MFDRISSTYDKLNRFFSLGVDRLWRRAAVKSLALGPRMRVLDCSAGTGDMAFEAHRQCSDVHTTLFDPSAKMLKLADEKAKRLQITAYALKCGAAERIDAADQSYDRFMVAFGIRNFQDLGTGLTELYRVLKPGGKGVILEFTPDRSKFIDKVFKTYMWWVMRPVGGAVSDDREAYKYLAETIQRFPASTTLIAKFHAAGFSKVEATPLSFGIATRFLLTK